MNIYYDTSILAKLYIEEPDSSKIEALHLESISMGTSWTTYAEMHSLTRRREREKLLSALESRSILKQFEIDWHSLVKIEVTSEIIRRAASLIKKYPLRAFDAIHLASALYFQHQLEEPITFLTADRQLLVAGRQEKLHTM